jgi:flagellin
MPVINTNLGALGAQASLSNIGKTQATAMQRLSTGLRINSAKDDAAGLAIATRMTSQIRGYAVAIRNSNDGSAMAQTADGAMSQVSDMLQRMRELAVQSANGTMAASDRQSSQAEVDQLKQQIQNIATQTNHNGINLLDGSAGNIKLQTGVDANQTMSMSFGSMQTKDIGMGSRASLSSVGGAISGNVNGVSVGASLATSDTLSMSANAASSAIAKAAAINAVSSQSGVFATVNNNEVAGSLMTDGGSSVASNTVTINGVTSSNFALTGNTEIDRSTVTNAINSIAAQTGVTATNSHDNSQGVSMKAADGRNITIAMTGGTNTQMGISAAGTYVGTYELNTKDGSAISVGSTVAESQQGQQTSGLTFGSYQANQAQVSTINRTVDSGTAGSEGVLNGNTLQINGVAIPAANGNDDTASDATAATSLKANSGIAIAAAINKSSAQTGVTATANANVLSGTGFTAGTVGNIYLNGQTITANLGSSSTRDDVLAVLNKYTGQTGVTASAYGNGIQLTAADGRNISISSDGAASALGLTGVAMGSDGTSATAQTYYSGVTLSSGKAIDIKSGSEGDVANLNKLGFQQGTYGGADNALKIANIDVSTTQGATDAINAIDAAISTVSENQSKAGAYQNRLTQIVNNLTTMNTNMSSARSQIQDADYGTETTNLAKAQIISQAATAMLAQANQSSQSVLSLLK